MKIPADFHSKWLALESSPVDWCEDNYVVTNYIAEFTNTFSNAGFLIIPGICFNRSLWKSYSTIVTKDISILFILLMVVGLASAYFHATLSLFGQMLDEVCIVWILCGSYSCLTPNHFRPQFFIGINGQITSAVIASLLTLFWFIYPALNAYGLFIVSVPCFRMLWRQLYEHKIEATQRLGVTTLYLSLFSILIWFIDKWMCESVKFLWLPGLHSIWHINMAVASYLALTVFGYWRAHYDQPNCEPTIVYWPNNQWGYGIPYVICKMK